MLNALPLMHFFKCGNSYTGEHVGMRYYVNRVKAEEGDLFEFVVWPEPWSLTKTPDEEKTRCTQPFTEEGLRDGTAWLTEQYESRQEEWEAARLREWGV